MNIYSDSNNITFKNILKLEYNQVYDLWIEDLPMVNVSTGDTILFDTLITDFIETQSPPFAIELLPDFSKFKCSDSIFFKFNSEIVDTSIFTLQSKNIDDSLFITNENFEIFTTDDKTFKIFKNEGFDINKQYKFGLNLNGITGDSILNFNYQFSPKNIAKININSEIIDSENDSIDIYTKGDFWCGVGAEINLHAPLLNEDFYFSHWMSEDIGIYDTLNATSYKMTCENIKDIKIKAIYQSIPIDTIVLDPTSLNLEGQQTGTYIVKNYKDSLDEFTYTCKRIDKKGITICFIPNQGYSFKEWDSNSNDIDKESSCITINNNLSPLDDRIGLGSPGRITLGGSGEPLPSSPCPYLNIKFIVHRENNSKDEFLSSFKEHIEEFEIQVSSGPIVDLSNMFDNITYNGNSAAEYIHTHPTQISGYVPLSIDAKLDNGYEIIKIQNYSHSDASGKIEGTNGYEDSKLNIVIGNSVDDQVHLYANANCINEIHIFIQQRKVYLDVQRYCSVTDIPSGLKKAGFKLVDEYNVDFFPNDLLINTVDLDFWGIDRFININGVIAERHVFELIYDDYIKIAPYIEDCKSGYRVSEDAWIEGTFKGENLKSTPLTSSPEENTIYLNGIKENVYCRIDYNRTFYIEQVWLPKENYKFNVGSSNEDNYNVFIMDDAFFDCEETGNRVNPDGIVGLAHGESNIPHYGETGVTYYTSSAVFIFSKAININSFRNNSFARDNPSGVTFANGTIPRRYDLEELKYYYPNTPTKGILGTYKNSLRRVDFRFVTNDDLFACHNMNFTLAVGYDEDLDDDKEIFRNIKSTENEELSFGFVSTFTFEKPNLMINFHYQYTSPGFWSSRRKIFYYYAASQRGEQIEGSNYYPPNTFPDVEYKDSTDREFSGFYGLKSSYNNTIENGRFVGEDWGFGFNNKKLLGINNVSHLDFIGIGYDITNVEDGETKNKHHSIISEITNKSFENPLDVFLNNEKLSSIISQYYKSLNKKWYNFKENDNKDYNCYLELSESNRHYYTNFTYYHPIHVSVAKVAGHRSEYNTLILRIVLTGQKQ